MTDPSALSLLQGVPLTTMSPLVSDPSALSLLQDIPLTTVSPLVTDPSALSLLQDIPLTTVSPLVTDPSALSLLQGVPLTTMSPLVSDPSALSLLQDIPLTTVSPLVTDPSALSLLQGVPLTTVSPLVTDPSALSLLQGLPLATMSPLVSDPSVLSLLQDIPLTTVSPLVTDPSALSLLQGVPLTTVSPLVSDPSALSLLQDIPLTTVSPLVTDPSALSLLQDIPLTTVSPLVTDPSALSLLQGVPLTTMSPLVSDPSALSLLQDIPLTTVSPLVTDHCLSSRGFHYHRVPSTVSPLVTDPSALSLLQDIPLTTVSPLDVPLTTVSPLVTELYSNVQFSFSAGIETNGQDSMMLMSGRGREEEEVCNCVPSRVVRCVSELMKYGEDPDPLKTSEVITTLGQLLKGHVSSKGEMLWNMDPESWKRTSLVERKKFIETVSLELILSSDSWAKDWKDKRCTCNDESEYMTGQTVNLSITNFWIFDELWIVRNIFPLVHKWEWGTVYNFFFNIKDNNFLSTMVSKEKIHLVDAGLKINSPYPPVLRTSRKVDLIISLDFSAGDPFETVFSANQYADELKLPFPPVKESVREEKDHPKGCYVFEGRHPEEPTVMHMPLFNLQNCQGKEEIKEEREKYTTFQQHYGVSEIDHLLKKAKDNLKNNRDRILEQILLAVKRRKNRKSVAQ
ncbi:uncharacterized protein LOC135574108 [Oncorhynchus nerka]|uniref:uncharacterized protein LOC135574108 n=1 Tax=Oncorhynchus nerka TaxID=8023 RepID=UPI0031B88198